MSDRARRRIVAELSARDMTLSELASALDMTTSYTAEIIATMADKLYCVDGYPRRGKYRLGTAPAGHTVDRTELTRRAILIAIEREAKSAPEIAEITGLSESFIRVTLRGMTDRMRIIASGPRSINGIVPTRYISIDAPRYVAPVDRVKLPGWAAALAL